MHCFYGLTARGFAALTFLACLLLAAPQPVDAQNDAAAPFDADRWKELVAQKEALVQKLTAMNQQLQDASDEDKQKLIQEANTLQQDFQSQVVPQMAQLAPGAFAADPKDLNAAELVLQIEYSKMGYDRVAQVADAILAFDEAHALALNFGGVANFAIHNFEKSIKLLEQAQAANALYPSLGGRYLESARSYVQYWQKEQGIRDQESKATGNQQLPRVKMTTGKGEIVLELFENEAPNTVANFISLTEKGYYDGLKFHRVLPSFMAQGGCPNTKAGAIGPPGSGGPGYTIKCEAYEPNARRHFAGTLSMAHAGKDTGGSQFFITHLPTAHLDQEVSPQSVHTVFGRVVDGMDVVLALRPEDAIEKVEVLRKRNHEYKPVTLPSAG